MKKILSVLLCIAMLLSVAVSAVTVSGGASADPADSYTKITAPNEDTSIDMWFEHSTVKVLQEEHTSSGRDTYSIYMAKNEIQDTQVILYSATTAKSGLTASVTDMTAMDGSGNTLAAELYYEFYVNVSDTNYTDVYGLKAGEKSIIREGMTPDAIAPISGISKGKGTFGLTAGKSQALLIRVKTELTSASGWYSGTFNLMNSNGDVIKTATFYTYVWNFEIPEKGTYQTSLFIDGTNNTTYKAQYDYLLENRLLGMQVPGDLSYSNEYLSNPRVTAFAIAASSGYPSNYKLSDTDVTNIYNILSTREDWEDIKERAYFYTVDEPTSKEQNDALVGNGTWSGARPTVDTVNSEYKRLAALWPDPYVVLPFHENTPYPYGEYAMNLAMNSNGTYAITDDGRAAFDDISDAIQGMMDANSVTIWCPKMCAYTPNATIKASGYVGTNTVGAGVRNLDGIISGFSITNVFGCYFDWTSKFGSFEERFNNYRAERAAEGQDIKSWWYACGNNANYTYANHLIENTGLQTQIMFWQSMQVGSTGYLYYGVNLWKEIGENNFTNGTGAASDGSSESGIWPVNKTAKNGKYLYGNGVLLYGSDVYRSKLRITGIKVLGTIRVEQMRDGIEDYEMLNLYRTIYGEDKMQALISKVSNNVADYLSLPLFDRSGYADSLTDDDIFAAVRIELGNAVEKGMGGCIEHSWDDGVITTEPTTTTTGVKTFTCTVCGETKEETVAKIKPGDVNGDGKVGAFDALMIKKYLAGDELTNFNLKAADVNGDGKVTSRDVLIVSMCLAGKVSLG